MVERSLRAGLPVYLITTEYARKLPPKAQKQNLQPALELQQAQK